MKQQHQEMTLGQQVNLLVFIGQCVSAPLAAFVRRPGTWGCRFVGMQGVLGMIFQPFCVAYLDHSDAVALPLFYATLAMFLIHRVAGFWRPKETHSRFIGRSWFRWLILEQLLSIGLGWFLLPVSRGLGAWLMLAGFGLTVDDAWQRARIAAQVRAIRDGRYEQAYIREVHDNG